MSEYRKLKTQFKSRIHLRRALKTLGIPFEECPSGRETHLYGHLGDERPEKATFVVRRKHIDRLSNDLGWHWNAKARCFEEVVSEYDRSVHRCTEIRRGVKREYAVAATIGRARARGYRVRRVDQTDGTVQLVVTGRV